MNRQQVKELLPIIKAFAEGKTIQSTWSDGIWNDINNEDFDNLLRLIKFGQVLRIKSEPKYRPFKDAKECWNEMQKHQPFGWVKHKADNLYSFICKVDEYSCHFAINEYWAFDTIFKNDTFIDGTPFGIKE